MSNLPDLNDHILGGAYADRDPEKERVVVAIVRNHYGQDVAAASEVLEGLDLLNREVS